MKVKNIIDPSLKYLEEQFDDEVTLLVDVSCVENDEEDAIAWLVESPDILEAYTKKYDFKKTLQHRLDTKSHKFKTLITSDPSYKNYDCVYMTKPCAPSWISKEDSDIYKKTNLVTYITSTKTFTPLQQKRVEVAEQLLKQNVPVFGRGIYDFDNKLDVLKTFKFCVVIENGIYENYHTEKILDCFRTGTVPIYLGDPKISDHFDPNGICQVTSTDEIPKVVEHLNETMYKNMLPAIHSNFSKALRYDNTPEAILKDFLNNSLNTSIGDLL